MGRVDILANLRQLLEDVPHLKQQQKLPGKVVAKALHALILRERANHQEWVLLVSGQSTSFPNDFGRWTPKQVVVGVPGGRGEVLVD